MKTQNITDLQLARVFPNPDQPRKEFKEGPLQELAQSIADKGVQQPIKVTPRSGGFMIVMGERRYRASILAGKKTIPAIIEELTDEEVDDLALIENIQREDLNIIEEAHAYQRRLDKGLTVEVLAKRLGYKKTGPIYDRLSLLNLRQNYQDLVVKGTLTPLQGYEISRLPQAKQDIAYQKVVKGELNTYNKLYAFVTAMINIEGQGEIFALAPLTLEEKESIASFDGLLNAIERFIKRVYEKDKAVHLQKAVFHSNVNGERLDYIIHQLQKVRRTVLTGEGVQKAMKEKAA